GGPKTTSWLYFIWHGGSPVFILAYAIAISNKPPPPAAFDVKAVVWSVGLACGVSGGAVLAATTFHALLPPIMSGNQDAPGKLVVAVLTWLVGIAALAVLW